MKITIIPNQIKAVAHCIPEIYMFLQEMKASFLYENPLLEKIIVNTEFCGYNAEPEFVLQANVLIVNLGVGADVNGADICDRIGSRMLKAA
ncbi:hypothetical protein FNO01nite_08470 [Flavobacterium noncentrifugens]|uniref:Uncharacterized protein n=1 Tax=Flavobacterium noncentrifugens TaxID=1128970 RepID=A0A1G8TF53_9FLAO|nr:hypothetical protein [Flavobacterium noncentrifugens]GEP50175.1 hypothetical protein FNO01nite_08470 [Flavobacterium noncentrifugens]SDJ39310.1 hypothetical protein SAMN04487935_0923 [Flavobacterium noncentrifugens]